MKDSELLQRLGLSDYEAQIYSALLRISPAPVRNLLPLVHVPRPQIYTTLKALVNRGLCTVIPGKFTLYSVTPPELALTGLLRAKKQELQAVSTLITRLIRDYHNRRQAADSDINFLEVLKGSGLKRLINQEVRRAQSELRILLQQPTESDEIELKKAVAFERTLLKRGIRIRCLYERRLVTDKTLETHIRSLIQAGEQARMLTGLPLNMMIIDDRLGTFSLNHRENAEVTVFAVRHPALVTALIYSFEYLWTKGEKLTIEKRR